MSASNPSPPLEDLDPLRVITPITASEAAFPDIHDEWADADVPFSSDGSSPRPPPLRPIASLSSPHKPADRLGYNASHSDTVPPLSVAAATAVELGFPDPTLTTPRGDRHLSETMESMDFAAQLERLSEKDLDTLWAALWSNTHSMQSLEHALAGPQTRWNPYRAARSGPHLRMEIMNSQVAEFVDVIPRDSLYLVGTAISRPAPTRPPGTGREAMARRRRAELDNLVMRSGGTPLMVHCPLAAGGAGSAAAPGGDHADAVGKTKTVTTSPGSVAPLALVEAASHDVLTPPVTWALASSSSLADLTLDATQAVIHTPDETRQLVQDALKSTDQRASRAVLDSVEEVFAWHGRQPGSMLAGHRSNAKLANLVPSSGTFPDDTVSHCDASGQASAPASFRLEHAREEMEARVFDALWRSVVVPFYTPPEPAAETTLRRDAPAVSDALPSGPAPSPAVRPRRASTRSSTAKSSVNSSSASETAREGPRSSVESSIVLHLRRHSVQEGLMDDDVTPDKVAPSSPAPPASRRHVTYNVQEEEALPSTSALVDSRRTTTGHTRGPSPHNRPRPRTGPAARHRSSPESGVVAGHVAGLTEPARGGASASSKRSTSTHLRHSPSRRSNPRSSPQESSIQMEDLDDSYRGDVAGRARDKTHSGGAAGSSRKATPTVVQPGGSTMGPLQRTAHLTLTEISSRRRGQTSAEKPLAKRAAMTTAGNSSPYLDGERWETTDGSRRVSRRASPQAAHLQRASPKRMMPIGMPSCRPTSVGGKPRHSGRVRSAVSSTLHDGSPLSGTDDAARRRTPTSRATRVSTAQVRPITASPSSGGPLHERSTTATTFVHDSWHDGDDERTADGLPTLEAHKATDRSMAKSGGADTASPLTRRGKIRGAHSASTRAPRTTATERPVTQHGSLSQAYRQYVRQPVTVRTLEGASRGPSPLASGKRARALKPLDHIHNGYTEPSS